MQGSLKEIAAAAKYGKVFILTCRGSRDFISMSPGPYGQKAIDMLETRISRFGFEFASMFQHMLFIINALEMIPRYSITWNRHVNAECISGYEFRFAFKMAGNNVDIDMHTDEVEEFAIENILNEKLFDNILQYSFCK